MCLDEYTGTVKRGVMRTSTSGKDFKSAKLEDRAGDIKRSFRKTLNMVKPQLQFKNALDPMITDPYRPRLTRKPNSIVSLDESLVPTTVNGRDKYTRRICCAHHIVKC